MAVPRGTVSLESMQQLFNEVLVQTGKALRTANRDGKGNVAQASMVLGAKIPQSIDLFNLALDDLECEITRAKSVIWRDIQELQAKKNPPQQQPQQDRPQSVPESKPVAPPAPMVIDLDSSPKITPVPVPAIPPQTPASIARPQKPESKPVAPFPNMGFDLTSSPEATPAPAPTKVPTPTPALAKVPTPTPAKVPTPVMNTKANPARPQPAGANNNRPESTPPRKESKVPVPQIPKLAAPAPSQAAAPAPTSASLMAPTPVIARPVSLSTTSTPPTQMPPGSAPGPESLFTNMGFTVGPPLEEAQARSQAEAPAQPPAAIDLTGDSAVMDLSLEDFEMSGTGADPAGAEVGPSGDDSVDAKIDGLFDLGPGGMDSMEVDYNLGDGGDGGGDNSNFDDLFFNAQDDNMDSNELDDAFFRL